MLYIHQSGHVRVGEVVRYTVTYTPSKDDTFPAPEKFHVRIRNTSAAALRAAVLAGPFTLSVSAYPATFDPFKKLEDPGSYGVPQFEPMVKAGAKWDCELSVPSKIRQAAQRAARYGDQGSDETEPTTVSWVIEVSSQILFTTAAAVGYHVMIASDHKSLKSILGTSALAQGNPVGKLRAHQECMRSTLRPSTRSTAGIFSRSMRLKVEDAEALWNSPSLLDLGSDDSQQHAQDTQWNADSSTQNSSRGSPHGKPKRKKVHLVIITHGLLSAIGADMLFLKEQIDAAVRQAKIDAKSRKAREGARQGTSSGDEDDDDEEVIVRGYSGNATKTQKGIRFLGKRVAKYVLSMTYPDQPYLPSGDTIDEGFAQGIAGDHHRHHHGEHIFMPHEYLDTHRRSYKITSISFIGHSLGGPTQTFAIAYIQKHCPDFFDIIKPRHFITLASPMLGVSNENPFYVRFALDSGLIGKSGLDLGLSWGSKSTLRGGIGSFVAGTRAEHTKEGYGNEKPESKPLMQILPTGPAHLALKKFQSRTVYANIVNDGIVPLRTSSLLFLDWQSIEKVERTRRDAGFVEMIAAIGWHEMTGTNLITASQRAYVPNSKSSSSENVSERDDARAVPQPSEAAMTETDGLARLDPATATGANGAAPVRAGYTANAPLAGFFKKFKEGPKEAKEGKYVNQKHKLMLSRGQTFHGDELPSAGARPGLAEARDPNANRSKSFPMASEIPAPPSTTIFEGFGDVLNPTVADVEQVIDPALRPKTVYHDRTYQPSDIPHTQRQSAMRVEEKIARSYHRDMSWRKVLVRLEPDAHNNIIVRRMFVNSHGWPVIKHLVDAHFSDAATNGVQQTEETEEILDTEEPRFSMLSAKNMDGMSMLPAYDPLGIPTPDNEERMARQLEALRMLEEPITHVTSQTSFDQSQMDLDELAWNKFNWSGSEYSQDEEAEPEPKMKKVVEALRKPPRQDKAQTWFGGRQ